MIHRRSRIARLPEDIRNQLNELLDSSTEYQRILDWLSGQGHTGFEMYHLTRWKDSGYQDWLARHEHADQLQAKQDWVQKLASEGASTLQKASMTILALKLFETISRTDSSEMSKLLEVRPEKIPALINSFARFCHESLEMEKFTETLRDKTSAAQDRKLTDKGAATPDTIRRMKRELRLMFRNLEQAERALETATGTATKPQPAESLAPTCT
jgi:hypothetical protein